jgi:hypothetical protein
VKINLTDKAYELLKMKRPSPVEPTTVIGRCIYESQCAGGNSFDRFQTAYQGIPEHLIMARDHD